MRERVSTFNLQIYEVPRKKISDRITTRLREQRKKKCFDESKSIHYVNPSRVFVSLRRIMSRCVITRNYKEIIRFFQRCLSNYITIKTREITAVYMLRIAIEKSSRLKKKRRKKKYIRSVRKLEKFEIIQDNRTSNTVLQI